MDTSFRQNMREKRANFISIHYANLNNQSGNLLQASDGVLYGTTSRGGILYDPQLSMDAWGGFGTVFKLNPDGRVYGVNLGRSVFRCFRRFDRNGGEGFYPRASLLEGSDGALYGTTAYGGITEAVTGYSFGTVFRLNKDGGGYTVLRRFTGLANGDGWEP